VRGSYLLVALGAVLLAACGGSGGKGPKDGGPPQPSQLDARLPGTPLPRPSGATVEQNERALYDELMKADARAAEEAEKAYPMLDPGAPGFDDERFRRQNNKRRAAREGFALKYRAQIAERNGLNRQQLEALLEKGRAQGWSSPTPPPP
jgi:hypothetical protein